MPITLCDLAATLPILVGRLLDREAKLKRGRFREETMTDLITGALAAFAGPNLVIEYPIEVDTGGDLDLRFWNVAHRQDFYIRLQAKRLNAAMNGVKPIKIKHRSYNELVHKPDTSEYQFRTLRDAPAPWVPLYIFYNHLAVTLDPFFAGKKPIVSGINLAFAEDVADELEEKLLHAASMPKMIKHHKRLSYLRKHFFGLEAILCPEGNWNGETVPPPHIVSESLRKRYLASDDGTAQKEDTEIMLRWLLEPGALSGSRSVGPRMPDGPSIRISGDIGRPTITFISGRTDDTDTPIIDGGHDTSKD